MKAWRKEAQRQRAKTGVKAPRGRNKRIAREEHANPLRVGMFASDLLLGLLSRNPAEGSSAAGCAATRLKQLVESREQRRGGSK